MIIKCKKPKMSNHRGRTWDKCDLIFQDGTVGEGYLDTTWGSYVYFHDNVMVQWYKFEFSKFMDIGKGDNKWDLRYPVKEF